MMALQSEYQCGRLTVNVRALVEPKGFLRIIMLVIALLAFAITAGFNSSNSNRLECTAPNSTQTQSLVISFKYPYTPGDFSFSTAVNCSATFSRKTFSSSAQYFVGMGVLTMLYVIAALIIYMLFITPELYMAKWLILGDFFLTFLFGLLYLLADIAWSVGIADLRSFVEDGLRGLGLECLGCTGEVNLQTFVQPAVSVIFGWLAAFLWLTSLWFVYKDTHWHKDQSGPLASLYAKKKGTGEVVAGGGGGETGGGGGETGGGGGETGEGEEKRIES